MKRSYSQCGTFGSSEDGRRDYHHLLWPRTDWSEDAAFLLRNDRYFGLIIPQTTLHRNIHHNLMNIPVPPLELCQDAYSRLYYARKHETIDVQNDPPEKRLNFLIHLWEKVAPETTSALEREIAFFEDYAADHVPPDPSPVLALALA